MKPGTRPPATTAHTTSSRSRKPRRNTIVPPLGPCSHPILWPAHPGRELPAGARAPGARGATRAVNAAHTSSPPPGTASRRRVPSLAAPAIWAQIRPAAAGSSAVRPARRQVRQSQIRDVDTEVIAEQTIEPRVSPRWVDGLLLALAVYVVAGSLWMLTGLGGPRVTHYVGLLSDVPAQLASAVFAYAVVRHTARGTLRGAWLWLTLSLGLYFVGVAIGAVSWLQGRDPFPGPADFCFCGCYLPLAAAGRAQIRRAAVPVRAVSNTSDTLARSLPFAAMLAAFLVLAYFSRGGVAGPATVMTMIVFGLMLLLMVRQGVLLRGDALVRERRAARLVEERYASLIANASDVIMIVTADGVVRFASPAAERTLGLRPEQITGRNLPEFWGGEDGERLRMFLHEVAAIPSGTVGPIELRIQRKDERCVIESVGSNLMQDPAVEGLALNFRDISERKALEEQLRQLAFHDPLTLLANRNLFRDRVQHAVTLAQRGHSSVAVMFLDLDNFKNINDSLGHDAGDRLLQAVAQRIVKATRSSDTVARLGGDEFAILVEGIATAAEVQHLADALIDALELPFQLDRAELRVAASVGVALSVPDSSAEALLSKADIAMYHAKAAGKNRHVTFQPQMQDVLHERMRLEADISRALTNQEFFVEYQPIIDLGTRSLLGVGVRLAIDDFGTGYSSLSYLHRFPIDILKIDRSFVSRLTSSDNGPELARAVITLGETLGLDTVAEGIELDPQVGALLALGCVAGQGFLFAKAGTLEELAKSPFVARRTALWTAQAAAEELSATGRFKALKAARRQALGAA